jgi:hypothetical protein
LRGHPLAADILSLLARRAEDEAGVAHDFVLAEHFHGALVVVASCSLAEDRQNVGRPGLETDVQDSHVH